ncbi:MAG: hypothetical protein KatS3mg056_0919 [Chloroflexus sp.]|jgi:hypothetical protein|nr:MAG: hypothetical protein KatS3mg056_0919 [Chloroflexus sp.]
MRWGGLVSLGGGEVGLFKEQLYAGYAVLSGCVH